MRPLRTVAGEITKGGNYRKVHRYIEPQIFAGKNTTAEIKQGVYMYQYLYHTSLDHMHLQNPTKKDEEISDPNMHVVVQQIPWQRKEPPTCYSHILLHGTSFTSISFVLFSFLTLMKKEDIYRVLMIKRVAPDVQIRKKER